MVDETVVEGAQSVYVVQVLDGVTEVSTAEGHERGGKVWADIATVTVPARAKRKGVIEKAIAQSGIDVEDGVTVRVLDASSAFETPVAPEPQPPKLRIG